MIWHKRSFTSHCVKLSPPDFFKCIYLRFWKKNSLCRGDISDTSASDLASGWRTRVQTESKLCSTNGNKIPNKWRSFGFFCPRLQALMTQRTLHRDPFTNQQELFLFTSKSNVNSQEIHFLKLFVEKLVQGRQIFLLEGEIVLWRPVRRILENVYFQGLCPVGL